MREAAAFLTDSGMRAPRAALVLGSGLSDAVELTEAVSVPYSEIPHFPVGSVDGHDGRVEFGSLAGAPVLVFRGRVHYYEGVPLQEATFPVRVARELGAKWIALTNASGAINPGFEVGDMVLLSDHLNLMGDNPLVGPNDDTVGPRFPDLSKAYSRALLHQAEAAALAAGVATRRGIYAAVSGPHYETPAEIRMLRLAGADLVGMSTVPETIVAVHAGMDVLGVSVVTDLAFPEDLQPLAHQEVVRAAAAAAPRVGALLRGVLEGESS
ncbi:MAG: purine-nucleoside phosphorylase [Gemmatimonadota bacterium]|jgi:purine-nucleoside phosphorylase|nr:purine-nucleoside phosphorylase [Gemmatimonadota bacterium]MDP6803540.1 purine-nucleoside phosphorylase [Gemmatimonadota bacterium]MDP7031916.1 purine-nucleoside phosphorylase [Gemmatimonadota bacterium]